MTGKRLTVMVVFILCNLVTISSAYSESDETIKKNALQFGVSDLINLNGYNGSMISIKHDFDPLQSITSGLSAVVMNKDDNNQTSDPDYIKTNDGFNNIYSFGISVNYLRYLTHEYPIRLYMGLGLKTSIKYDVESYKYIYVPIIDSPVETKSENEKLVFGFGPVLITGVEIKITDEVRVFSEYKVNGITEYSYEKKVNNSQEIENESMSYVINADKITLGITLYFE